MTANGTILSSANRHKEHKYQPKTGSNPIQHKKKREKNNT